MGTRERVSYVVMLLDGTVVCGTGRQVACVCYCNTELPVSRLAVSASFARSCPILHFHFLKIPNTHDTRPVRCRRTVSASPFARVPLNPACVTGVVCHNHGVSHARHARSRVWTSQMRFPSPSTWCCSARLASTTKVMTRALRKPVTPTPSGASARWSPWTHKLVRRTRNRGVARVTHARRTPNREDFGSWKNCRERLRAKDVPKPRDEPARRTRGGLLGTRAW